MRTVTVRSPVSDPGRHGRRLSGRGGNRMPPRATGVARGTSVAGSVRRQVRELRKALRSGTVLDALAAAARIYAIGIQPNMRDGRWPRAQACCERVLGHIPARQEPGYRPSLRGVLECLHADAARAAREGGDLDGAKPHLNALAGYLRERHAPVARQVVVLTDLAFLHIDSGDARAGGRMLASIAVLAASAESGTGRVPADLWRPRPRLSVPSQRKPAD